jgi:hypothetical protein
MRYDFITDDAYISFVYARNFARSGQMVYNLGMDPVEGYTNFLWTFLLGVLMKFGWQPESSARVLLPVFAIGTMCCAAVLMRWAREGERYALVDVMPAALLAGSAGYACWASGGLETQLFTLLTTAGVMTYALSTTQGSRLLMASGVLLAGAAMTRPEGLFVTGAIGLHRLGYKALVERSMRPTRDELLGAAAFLVVWAPWFVWRWNFYGYPFPNTYYVKAADASPDYKRRLFELGLYYLKRWDDQTHVVWGLPLILPGLLAQRRGRRLFLGTLLVPLAALYLLYVARVGGDFIGLHRFIMPVFVWAAIGAGLGVWALSEWLAGRERWVAWALGVALVCGFGWQQQGVTQEALREGNWRNDRGIDTPSFLKMFAHDQGLVGATLKPCLREDDLAIVGGAGAQVYAGDFKALDVYGLVSEEIAHTVPPTVVRPGHNKVAPYELLASFKPTLLLYCSNLHEHMLEDSVPCSETWWRARGYDKVTIEVPGLIEGRYYTFMKRADRDMVSCPAVVRTY